MSSSSFATRLYELSPPQREAVQHGEGPLLVVAGAGSGKTRTLTYRAARLVYEGVDPRQILIVTFTNRAAREFRERLQVLLGPTAQQLWMSTLHAAGVRILRRYGAQGGLNPDFLIYDQRDSLRLLRRLAQEAGYGGEEFPAAEILHQILAYKDRLLTVADVAARKQRGELEPPCSDEVLRLFQAYTDRLRRDEAFDFSDLIGEAVRLFDRVPDLQRQLGLQYVLVDELQDTDPAQWRLLRHLLPPAQNLTGVGDVDQSVYRFRGADPSIMRGFRETFPQARVVALGQNYRSTALIVSAAQAVIQRNQDRIQYRVWSDRLEGNPIGVIGTDTPEDEAERIARHCARLHHQYGIPYPEMAVLYRVNFQGLALEQQFLRRQIPYQVKGTRFFERAEIRDLVGYLRLLYREDDWLAFQDLAERPPREISKSALEKVAHLIEAGHTPLEALDHLEGRRIQQATKEKLWALRANVQKFQPRVSDLALAPLIRQLFAETELMAYYKGKDSLVNNLLGDRYTDNVEHLIQVVQTQFPGPAREELPRFLEYAALMGEAGGEQESTGVQLLTVHAAKGTEYRVVMVAGVEERFLPHARSLTEPAGLEEERRLFYVAMTRAKDSLFLYHAKYRPQGREYRPSRPSRFLDEIPDRFKQFWRSGPTY